MELTKTKLNKILKKYRKELLRHEKEWKEICRKASKHNTDSCYYTPSIYEHERHNAKGSKLFKDIMEEFSKYEVFPKNNKK